MKNNFRQKFFSLLLALLMMVELLPMTTLHSHAAGPSSQTISFDYTSEYDDPNEALIDKAKENFSREGLYPSSVFSENSWARVYNGELTKNGGKMRDYLESSLESEKYIIMAEDIEVRIGRGEWVPIRITSDKVLDLNGFTLTYWDITNKTDDEDSQSTEVTHHYENKYLFEIKNGATLTIIDSSMSTNGVDTTLGRGQIIAGAYMIDAFEEQIDYYTTRDIFRVDGNLVIYGGTFQAGRQKDQYKKNFTWDGLFDAIGATVSLGMSIAEYATGIQGAEANLADVNDAVSKVPENKDNTSEKGDTQTDPSTGETTGSSGTNKKDGSGDTKKNTKVDTPETAKSDGGSTSKVRARGDSSSSGSSGKGSGSGREQTVKERTDEANENVKNDENGGSAASNGDGTNEANKDGTAKKDGDTKKGEGDEKGKHTKIAEAEKAVVNAWMDEDKINGLIEGTRTVVTKILDLVGNEENSRITHTIHGSVAKVGAGGTMVVYNGRLIGHGSTEHTRNAVIEVVRKNFHGENKTKSAGGLVYVYGGTFEGYAGANIFNIVKAGSTQVIQIPKQTYDEEKKMYVASTTETVDYKLPISETNEMKVLHYENQEEVETAADPDSVSAIPVDTSNIVVRNGSFRCHYDLYNVGIRTPFMQEDDPKGDKATFTRVIGTSGTVNLGLESFGEDMIRDGRIQLTDTYGDGTLVLMDETADEAHPTGLKHYRLYCSDIELRHIRYLDVAPMNAGANATHSFALSTYYGSSNKQNISTWNSENDLENDHSAPFADDEYFFDYEYDAPNADSYYVQPDINEGMYGENDDTSEVWYYNIPVDNSGKPIEDIGGYTTVYAHYYHKAVDKWFYVPISDISNLDFFDEDGINKETYYAEEIDQYRYNLKWFRYRVYRVDPITRENISESDVWGEDVPLAEVIYGAPADSDAVLQCQLYLDEVAQAIKKNNPDWEGYQSGELYRIVLNVDEYMHYGFTGTDDSFGAESSYNYPHQTVDFAYDDILDMWMPFYPKDRTPDAFVGNLPTASIESSILFRCSSINEQAEIHDVAEDAHVYYDTDYTPLQFENAAIAGGEDATVNFVNAKVSQADNAGSDFIDVYYQWYVSEDGEIHHDEDDAAILTDTLLAGTTNVCLDWDQKSDHLPYKWNPEKDPYDYRNSLAPDDPNYVAYGEDGLPDDQRLWDSSDLHAYTTELRDDDMIAEEPARRLDMENNLPFMFNTDSCYIPEELAGKYVYVRAVVTNLKPGYDKLYDRKQVFYSHPVLVVDGSILTASAQEPATPAYSEGDGVYSMTLNSSLGQDMIFGFTPAKVNAEMEREGYQIKASQKVYKKGHENNPLYHFADGEAINLKDYATESGIYFVEQTQQLVQTQPDYSKPAARAAATSVSQKVIISRTDRFKVVVDFDVVDSVTLSGTDGYFSVGDTITVKANVDTAQPEGTKFQYTWEVQPEGGEAIVHDPYISGASSTFRYTFEDETPCNFKVTVRTVKDEDGWEFSYAKTTAATRYIAPCDPMTVTTTLNVGGEEEVLSGSKTISVATGTEVSMEVTAEGGYGTYSYYNYNKNNILKGTGSTFRIDTSKKGTNTYYIVVEDAYGNSILSEIVTVQVIEAISITESDETTFVLYKPGYVNLWIEYVGADVTARVEKDTGSEWVEVASELDGYDVWAYVETPGQYRVVLTDSLGETAVQTFIVYMEDAIEVAATAEGTIEFRSTGERNTRNVFTEGETILADHTAEFIYDGLHKAYKTDRQYFEGEGLAIKPSIFDVKVNVALYRYDTPGEAYSGAGSSGTKIYAESLAPFATADGLPENGMDVARGYALEPGYYYMEYRVYNETTDSMYDDEFEGNGSYSYFNIAGSFEILAAGDEHEHDFSFCTESKDSSTHVFSCICGEYEEENHYYNDVWSPVYAGGKVDIGMEARYCQGCYKYSQFRWSGVEYLTTVMEPALSGKVGETIQLHCEAEFIDSKEELFGYFSGRDLEILTDWWNRTFDGTLQKEQDILPGEAAKITWSVDEGYGVTTEPKYVRVDEKGNVTLIGLDTTTNMTTVTVNAEANFIDGSTYPLSWSIEITCDHDIINEVPAAEGDCTNPGYIDHYQCAVCGQRTLSGLFDELPMDLDMYLWTGMGDHEASTLWSFDNAGHWQECKHCGTAMNGVESHDYNVDAADCTTAKTCVVCGYEAQKQQSHRLIIRSATATCDSTGMREHYECIYCDSLFADVAGTVPTTEAKLTVRSLGHDFAAADCDTPRICTRCKTTEGKALGHDWSTASCDAPKTCLRCKATEGTALGHNWSAATCALAKTCSVCHMTEGSALGHTAPAASCTSDSVCSVCARVVEEALPHNYKDGECTVCHTAQPDVTVVQKEIGGNDVSVKGNVVTVTPATPAASEIAAPCKIGYLKGDTFVEVAATKSGTDYTFEVPAEIEEVVIVVEGDANGDGEVNSADISALLAALLGKGDPMKAEQSFASNVNGDKKTNVGDLSRLTAVLLKVAELEW